MLDKAGIANLIQEKQSKLEEYLKQNPGDDPLRVRKRRDAKRMAQSEINLLEKLHTTEESSVVEFIQIWMEEFKSKEIEIKEAMDSFEKRDVRDLMNLDELRFLYKEKHQLIRLLEIILESEGEFSEGDN